MARGELVPVGEIAAEVVAERVEVGRGPAERFRESVFETDEAFSKRRWLHASLGEKSPADVERDDPLDVVARTLGNGSGGS